MPDWSYQTVLRPVLFRMQPETARNFALGGMGRLSRLPLGPSLIALLGHMRPDPRLQHTVRGLVFASRVGIGTCIDPQLLALRALSQFGLGFLEIGPFTRERLPGGRVARDDARETLTFSTPEENPGLEAVDRALDGVSDVRLFVRLSEKACGKEAFERDAATVIDRLGARICGVIFDPSARGISRDVVERLTRRFRAFGPRLVLAAVAADEAEGWTPLAIELTAEGTLDGVLAEGGVRDASGATAVGRDSYERTRNLVVRMRRELPDGAVIVAAGGIHEPLQALEMLRAGCDLLRVDTGLIFSGPGLPKRINEAVLYQQLEDSDGASDQGVQRLGRMSWYWTALIGLAMLVGGVMAVGIAATRVVMPYDEATVGMTRAELDALNPHLLHFMQHDRMTLAGTMLAVGILYFVLSIAGSRRGMHWAHVSIVTSSFTGFASFFLFLGFGYFDPFHAFVTAVLLQPLLLAIHSDLPPSRHPVGPELTNDSAWRRSQWGQLVFIVHGAILVVAGCVISAVGISTVFVPEDLEFMHTTAEHLTAAHPLLVPLVAHDRASFGGMLLSVGVCVLLSSLWGFRRGNGWLWWALMTAGSAAYLTTIMVHWHVDYMSLKHLLPAYGGLALLFIGGGLSYQHLCGFRTTASPL